MQCITTKYLPWTDTKPSRFKATTSSGISVTVSAPMDDLDGHDAAVGALIAKLRWAPASMIRGEIKTGFVYVFDNGEKRKFVKGE